LPALFRSLGSRLVSIRKDVVSAAQIWRAIAWRSRDCGDPTVACDTDVLEGSCVRGEHDYFEADQSMAGIGGSPKEVNRRSAMTGCYSLDEVRRLKGDGRPCLRETLLGQELRRHFAADSADAYVSGIARTDG